MGEKINALLGRNKDKTELGHKNPSGDVQPEVFPFPQDFKDRVMAVLPDERDIKALLDNGSNVTSFALHQKHKKLFEDFDTESAIQALEGGDAKTVLEILRKKLILEQLLDEFDGIKKQHLASKKQE